jgi:hypothetical protein
MITVCVEAAVVITMVAIVFAMIRVSCIEREQRGARRGGGGASAEGGRQDVPSVAWRQFAYGLGGRCSARVTH